MCAHYELHSGRSTQDIDYYMVLARWKLAIVLEQGYSRFLSGAAVSESVASFGPIVLDLMNKAGTLARSLT
jgi:hypothetical protein